MFIETIRLSQKAKDQLVRLKRLTGIKNWNVLCRWAFARSLAEPSVPPAAKIPADSSVEMSWRVFAGDYHEIYAAMLRERCQRDGIGVSDAALAAQLRLHLHRGIGYLAADQDAKNIAGLVSQVATAS